MKKRILYLVAATFLLSGSSQAFWGKKDPSDMSKEERKELKRAEKEAREQRKRIQKEARKREKELEKEQKRAEKEARKRQKELEKEQRKAEKEAEKRIEKAEREEEKRKREAEKEARKAEKKRRYEEKKLERQRRDEERRLKKEKKKQLWAFNHSEEGKKLKKEERKAKKLEKQRMEAEKAEQKRLDKEAHKLRKKEKNKLKKQQRAQDQRLAKQEYEAKMQRRYDEVRRERRERDDLIQKWALHHNKKVVDDYAQGKYSELYRVPAWPVHAQYYENDHYFNVEACYNYATDSYDSSGSSSSSDVTRLAFGEDQITLKDISLVSKLLSQQKLAAVDVNLLGTPPVTGVLQIQADKAIKLNGQVESYGVKVDFSRYIFRNNLVAGIQIPVLYKKHYLRFDFPFKKLCPADDNFAQDLFNEDFDDGTINLTFRKLLAAKCFEINCKNLKAIGNSATGIGDISAFISGHVDSTYFDKIIFGLRVNFPTAKKALQHKLWSPELGNGGSTDFTGYLGAHVSYKKYLNPHILIEGTFSTDAHVDRRVPKRFTHAGGVTSNSNLRTLRVDKECPFEALAFSDRVKLADNTGQAVGSGRPSVAFDDFDTCVKGFADNIAEVEFTRGPELNVRLGNMFERFITHRGFFDMFYDLRVKARDEYRGLCEEDWNLALLRVHTQEIEHRLGFDFSHQFDWDTRLRCGMRYTFAGMNVPKTFTLTGGVSHTF